MSFAVQGFPFRLNISYLLSDDIRNFAEEANRMIFDAGGEFEFIPRGVAIPHITMLMGDVDNERVLVEIDDVVREAAAEFDEMAYEVSAPYFRDRQKRYMFLNVEPAAEFVLRRRELQRRLDGMLRLDHYGSSENISHITLGYMDHGGDDALLNEVSAIKRPQSNLARELQLAVTGRRGTCVQTLSVHSRN